MELADCMEPFVKATYNLEGDGFLALEMYERINALNIAITSKHMPNVTAMAKDQANGNAVNEQQLSDYSDVWVKPAYVYFKLKFDQDLKPAFLKLLVFFLPQRSMQLGDVGELSVFPFFIDRRTQERASDDVSPAVDPIAWWKNQEYRLPNWSRAYKYVTLIQPSSAAAERFFSLLSNSFKSTQEFLRTTSKLQLCCSTTVTDVHSKYNMYYKE